MRRMFLKAAAAVAVGLIAAPRARAAGHFDQAAFDAAQAAGKPILVAVHADWCPICAKQRPILSRLLADPAFKDVVMFTVDFDSQKDVVKAFGVRMQSTLIAYHGKTEEDRSTGATDETVIRALVAKTMA